MINLFFNTNFKIVGQSDNFVILKYKRFILYYENEFLEILEEMRGRGYVLRYRTFDDVLIFEKK